MELSEGCRVLVKRGSISEEEKRMFNELKKEEEREYVENMREFDSCALLDFAITNCN